MQPHVMPEQNQKQLVGQAGTKTSVQSGAVGSLGFVVAMWGLSRLVVILAMVVIAPLLPSPPGGFAPIADWSALVQWDSNWYYHVVNFGYHYADDGQEYSIAFFPLFPLLIQGLMMLGLPFEPAGLLLNNLGFLGAVTIAYRWLTMQHGEGVARWTVLVLLWCPLSFFGSVLYSEGLFLLFSTAALATFERKQYLQAGIWAALASATRFQGVMLAPAFLIAAWKGERSTQAYLSGLMAGLGTALFSLYCWVRFDDPLVFVHVQRAWRSSLGGVDWQGWLQVINGGMFHVLATEGWWQRGMMLLWLGLSWLGVIYLWRSRHRLAPRALLVATLAVLMSLWLQWGNELVTANLTLGGVWLLWQCRDRLTTSTLVYGMAVMSLIAVSGSIMSIERIAYGTVSISIAYGMTLWRSPWIGTAILLYGAIALVPFAIRFAQGV